MTVQLPRGEPHKIKIIGVYAKSDVIGGFLVSSDLVRTSRSPSRRWAT